MHIITLIKFISQHIEIGGSTTPLAAIVYCQINRQVWSMDKNVFSYRKALFNIYQSIENI